MKTIMDLPSEIFAEILKYKNISIEDVENFNSCKNFQHIDYGNKFWKKKFSQRWPSAKKVYDEQEKDIQNNHNNFMQNVKTGLKDVQEMWHYISDMSEKHYYYNDYYNKDIEDLNVKFRLDSDFMNPYILMDVLRISLFKSPRESADLTQRYYSIKVFQYLLRFTLKKKWDEFMNRPEDQQFLEIIANIMIQWYQPEKYISSSNIETLLDKIAEEVLKYLKKEYPAHSMFSTSNQFSFLKHNINNNCWNEIEAKQIKYILDKIIFDLNSYGLDYPWRLSIRSDQEDVYIANMLRIDTFIDSIKVDPLLNLQFWRDAFLLITYHSVARRLGIHCELIQNFGHENCDSLIHIAWQPSNTESSSECFHINWLNDKANQQNCELSLDRYQNITLERIKNHLSCLNVDDRFSPNDVRRTKLREIENYTLQNKEVPFKEQPKERDEELKKEIEYAVGMIVRHNHNQDENNNKAGVIIGWDGSWDLKSQLAQYRRHESYMSLSIYEHPDHLRTSCLPDSRVYTRFQPHYLILSNNNEICYAAQSTITSICTNVQINNTEIGRYFCRFKGTHYLPNEMLTKYYPSDAAVIHEFISKNKMLLEKDEKREMLKEKD